MENIAPDIFKIRLFGEDVCGRMLDDISRNTKWSSGRVTSYAENDGAQELVVPSARDALVADVHSVPVATRLFSEMIKNSIIPEAQAVWSRVPYDFEDPQVVKYGIGQQFKRHRDWGKAHPRRSISIVCYLNAQFTGGGTYFDILGESLKPDPGEALIFASDLIHAGQPVESGMKVVALSFLLSPKPVDWI